MAQKLLCMPHIFKPYIIAYFWTIDCGIKITFEAPLLVLIKSTYIIVY